MRVARIGESIYWIYSNNIHINSDRENRRGRYIGDTMDRISILNRDRKIENNVMTI